MDIVIISGLSGAGKSQTAAAMEDMGYYCVDNMPVEMIPKFVDLCLATSSIFLEKLNQPYWCEKF